MVFVFGALMISFALMNVDLAVVLLMVFAYLFVVGSHIYYRVKFEKEL
jgi:4-hydroxybenzoate polyprenyltransferase